MPFATIVDAESRLKEPSPLSAQEVRDLMPYMGILSGGAVRRLEAELALQNIQAVQQFNTSSSRMTRWMLWLTIAIAVMTAIMTIFYVTR
jgi:hypothetical protein